MLLNGLSSILPKLKYLDGTSNNVTAWLWVTLGVKLKDIKTEIIKEKDGSYAIACSVLGIYTVGSTLKGAKRNFREALELHLSVLKDKAMKEVEAVVR